MEQLLFSIFGFVIAIGVLVAIHEFGHFWVARRLGVKVLRFSIGFGSVLFSRQGKDGTEYALSAIPLGGYVKMLDEREGEVAADELHLAFNRQAVWKRILIVLAGPAFNFFFAIAAYWLLFVNGIPGMQPDVASIQANTPAAIAQFQPGDRVLSVDGEQTPTWRSVEQALLNAAVFGETVVVEVSNADSGSSNATTRKLDLNLAGMDLDSRQLMADIGLTAWRPEFPAVVGQVLPNSPAQRAGLQTKDQIISSDGEAISGWNAWVDYVQQRPEQVIELSILRDDKTLDVSVIPNTVKLADGRKIGRVGVGVHVGDAERAEIDGRRAVQRYPMLAAVGEGMQETWEMSWLTLKMLGKIVTGQASWRQIGGPIHIAEYAGYSVQNGFNTFLSFLAIISISLGVLNLLPIPVLDGGHLLYYVLEIFKGSPVSLEAQALGQRIGIALLLMLMSVAFYNDISRLLTRLLN